MSAGAGVMHQHDRAAGQTTRFLPSTAIRPNVRGVAPGYGERASADAGRSGTLRLVASPDQGARLGVLIHADAAIAPAC